MTEPRPQTESELIERLRAIEVQAPPELHQRVNAMISEHAAGDRRAPRPTLGLRWAGASALATAVAIVAIVLAVGGGSAPAPALTQAAKLTLRPATLPAPGESSSRHATLTAQVEGVAFPYWKDRFGWNASGARTDRVDGRLVRTVFYRDGNGRRIGYAIVSGGAPASLSAEGGRWVQRRGSEYRLLSVDGTQTVAWLRGGHLCVVSGRGVDGATLVRLASWREGSESRA